MQNFPGHFLIEADPIVNPDYINVVRRYLSVNLFRRIVFDKCLIDFEKIPIHIHPLQCLLILIEQNHCKIISNVSSK